MRPHISAPQGPADEVSVVISDSAVVDGGDCVNARDRFDQNRSHVAAKVQIAHSTGFTPVGPQFLSHDSTSHVYVCVARR